MGFLLALAAHFALLSLIAIGGVSATLPDMHRYLVEVNGWLTDQQFSAMYALSQAAPGPNMLFVALFGWQVAGLAGMLAATIGICGPSSMLALLFEIMAGRNAQARWPEIVRRGLAPMSIGLLLATGWLLAYGMNGTVPGLLATALTVALTLRTRIHPLWMIGAGAAAGSFGLI